MNSVNIVMYAGMLTWLALGAYLFILGKKQAVLNKKIAHLSQLEDE